MTFWKVIRWMRDEKRGLNDCLLDESSSNGYDVRANKILGTFYAKSRYLTYVEGRV